MEVTKSGDEIGFSEKLGYGLGDFACNIVWNSLSMFILYRCHRNASSYHVNNDACGKDSCRIP